VIARVRGRSDTGSAAVLAAVMTAVLLTLALAGTVLGGLVVGQRRAAAAADLAALAAADAVSPGLPGTAAADPCRQAESIGSANGALLTGCRVEGLEVVVEVTVEVPSPLGGWWKVPGAARAGPAGAGPTALVGP
jgi:secretion/DNA translocation related TadE-like protein